MAHKNNGENIPLVLLTERNENDDKEGKIEKVGEENKEVKEIQGNKEGKEIQETKITMTDKKDDNDLKCKIPELTYLQTFLLFLSFGIRAWGGPAAQIDMIKTQLVIEEKWITVQKFNRVLAVYQALPGPEATELCCYFGMLVKGRIGSLLGGLGFLLPGFCLMLLFSWLYVDYGLNNHYVQASFNSIQPCVTAMIFRAVYRLSEHAFQNSETHTFSYSLFLIGSLSALESVLHINFFIILAHCGIVYLIIAKKYYITCCLLNIISLISYVIYVVYVGYPKNGSFGIGGVGGGNNSYLGLFLLGLFGGLITFGGAYTAIPFLRQDAVVLGRYMTNSQFLDGIAIGAVLPSPLVIISTFVGYIGHGIGGAILMTIGMFLPALSFTFIGHDLFEWIIEIKTVSIILDGITACVIGMIFITAFELLKSAIIDSISSILFILSLMCLQQFKNKWTQPILVIAGAIVGQALYQ